MTSPGSVAVIASHTHTHTHTEGNNSGMLGLFSFLSKNEKLPVLTKKIIYLLLFSEIADQIFFSNLTSNRFIDPAGFKRLC